MTENGSNDDTAVYSMTMAGLCHGKVSELWNSNFVKLNQWNIANLENPSPVK